MENVIDKLVKDVALPKMVRIRQVFPRPAIRREEIPGVIAGLLRQEKFRSTIRPGMRVCITCGSRGISNIDTITRSIADFVRSRGAEPFVVPAMGSHGGATAEGQLAILEGVGVTPETVGCPVLSSMETVVVGHSRKGYEVRIDKNAAGADAIIVNGRIKPHTAFRGPYESGLMKMMTIGLGKQEGAESCHSSGFKYLAELVPEFGRIIMQNAPIAFGVGCIENPYDDTARLIALLPEEIDRNEPKYLQEAFSLMARIGFDECDVLVVDEFGKDISGEGMDPNITGTFATEQASGGIRAQKRAVLGLTKATHGNAHGIGMVDVITRRLFEQMDLDATYPNTLTSTVFAFSKIPLIMKDDETAIKVCVKACNEIDQLRPRIIRIKNTKELGYIYISEAMLEEAERTPGLEICGEPEPICFDAQGRIRAFEA